MRRAYKVALVSFVVALPLLMAPTGGIPSRPTFAKLTVRADQTTNPAIVNRGTQTGASSMAWLQFQDTTGAGIGYVGDASTGNSDIQLAASVSGANVNLVTAGTGVAQANGVTITTNGVEPAGGTAVVRVVAAQKKGGNTDKTNDATLAADVTLTGLPIPSAGQYLIDGFLCFVGPTSGANGIKIRYEFSGSVGTGSIGMYTGTANSAVVAAGNFVALDANQISFGTIATGSGGDCITFRHTMNALGAGTVDVQWAQAVAGANTTRLLAGSTVIITRTG